MRPIVFDNESGCFQAQFIWLSLMCHNQPLNNWINWINTGMIAIGQ